MKSAAGFGGACAVVCTVGLLIASAPTARAQPPRGSVVAVPDRREPPAPQPPLPPAEEVTLNLPADGEPLSPAEEVGLAVALQMMQGQMGQMGQGWEACASGVPTPRAGSPVRAAERRLGAALPVVKRLQGQLNEQTVLRVDVAPAAGFTIDQKGVKILAEMSAEAAGAGAEVRSYAIAVHRLGAEGEVGPERKSFFESRSNVALMRLPAPPTQALYQIVLPGGQSQEVLITTYAPLTADDLKAVGGPLVSLFGAYDRSKGERPSEMEVRGSSMRLAALHCLPPMPAESPDDLRRIPEPPPGDGGLGRPR